MSGSWDDPPAAPPGPEYPRPHDDPLPAQHSALATTEAGRRTRPPWKLGIALRFAALLASVAILAYGLNTLHESRTHETRATRSAARADRDLTRAQEQERIARSDLTAAQAALADFTLAAQGAADASAQLISVEAALTDRLAKLRAAGSSGDFATYNRLVDELNVSVEAIRVAATNLNTPFTSLSRALTGLPTARCSGPVATPVQFVPYGNSGLRCARIPVPLDYSHPRASTLTLTLVIRPADDAAQSKGPLVLNPGGPGGSAIAFLREASLLLPADVLRQFDLVGVDPRGVGQSTPVDCADNLDPLFDNRLTDPEAPVRIAALRRVQALIEQCRHRSGAILPFLDTTSAARDLDRVRVALGKDQISYLGFSYGTYLGAVYADLFPTHLRAAVLDGAVDPKRAQRTVSLSPGGSNFVDAFDAAMAACATDTTCPFYSGGNPRKAFDTLMASLTVQPLKVGARELGTGLAELGVISVLYEGTDGWHRLTDALAHAALGDGGPLLGLSDGYAGRRKDGSYNNELEAHYAINCIEVRNRPSPDAARRKIKNLGSLGLFDTADLMLTLPCAFWPAPPVRQNRTINGTGAPTILIVGNAGDPVTPIENAEELKNALGGSVLLRWEGDGHTVVGRGVACIDDAVTAYLVDLKAPAPNTSCPA